MCVDCSLSCYVLLALFVAGCSLFVVVVCCTCFCCAMRVARWLLCVACSFVDVLVICCLSLCVVSCC